MEDNGRLKNVNVKILSEWLQNGNGMVLEENETKSEKSEHQIFYSNSFINDRARIISSLVLGHHNERVSLNVSVSVSASVIFSISLLVYRLHSCYFA